MATKEQERNAFEEIKKIVESLGENSYVATAFAGCFEIAEENIEYDAADSLKERLATATEEEEHFHTLANELRTDLDEMETENKYLRKELEETRAKLDKELEWTDCQNMGTRMSQIRYKKLQDYGKELSEEAKKLIAREFGFDPQKITIVPTAETFESNKYRHARVKESYSRDPVYCSTDWNYIRFDCSDWYYEMIDGQLYQYYC